MIFFLFEKNLSKISTKIQRHFSLFHAMHSLFKRALLRVDRQKNDKNLIEKSNFVVKANRINFDFFKKTKNSNRNVKKKNNRFIFYSKKKNEILLKTLIHLLMFKQRLTIRMLIKK